MSILSSLNPSAASAPLAVKGLISGIDTNKVVQALLAIEQQKIDNIAKKETAIQSQQSAFKSVEAKLLALQGQMTPLARTQNGVFDTRMVLVSEPTSLAAAAASSAQAGDFHLRINSLALAHQIASQGFDSLTSAVTRGTFSIQAGAATTNVVIDETNDNLQGLANAINNSGAGVTATLISDGAASQSYRLLLTSNATGTSNRILVTNNLGESTSEATKPQFDADVVQDAADASITLGSGAGALTFTNSSNKIDSLIPGVTLSLKNADPTKDITLTVANDTDGMANAIHGFVSAYNDVLNSIAQQTAFDSTSGRAGPLLGNRQVLGIEKQLRSAIQSVVAGANSKLNHLGALGISTNDHGQLAIDDAKLSGILAGNSPGIDLDDVRTLFTLTGTSSNAGIQFVSAGSSMRAATTPYVVHISQAAQTGQDVAGSFLVNGVPEAAVGSGQFLVGDSSNVNTAGLKVRVTLTPTQVGSGIDANLTVRRGVASQLDNVLTNLFDPVSGRLKSIDDDYAAAIQRLETDQARETAFMNARQQQLQTQFDAMERTLSQLQSASNLLALQSANMTQKK